MTCAWCYQNLRKTCTRCVRCGGLFCLKTDRACYAVHEDDCGSAA